MRYRKELCKKLVEHFCFKPGEEPPVMDTFRDREGISCEDFEAFCQIPEFAAAVEEARRRYLDTLTAGALLKKYDPAFVKHLLELDVKREVGQRQGKFDVEIRVVE